MAEHKERQALEQTQALIASTLLEVKAAIDMLEMGIMGHPLALAHDLQRELRGQLDSTNEALEMCLLWEQDNE